MHHRTNPDNLRWQIEVVAGKACEKCGGTIDGAALHRYLDDIISRATDEMAAALAELHQFCHECHEGEQDNGREAEWENGRVGEREQGARGQPSTRVPHSPTPPLSHPSPRLHHRRAEIAQFFQNSPARIIGNPGLREPQIESYLAIRDYFSQPGGGVTRHGLGGGTPLPAIVEIPTGCGKTGIICAAPFGIAHGRVLVILPNLTIKRNLVKSLSPLTENNEANADNFYLKCGIFENLTDLPKFVVLDREQVNREDCLRADIVITNIQQIQGWLRHFENDFFDMIIVDEAHHEPAESWQRVNKSFPHAKKIYLTATPFRCDHKLIVGETIYRYRLAQAISQGYVKNVMRVDAVASKMTFTMQGEVREFSYDEILSMREELWFSKGVALSEVSNQTIIDRSIAIWKEKRKSGVPHQIIASACSIRHATQIVALYQARGLRTTHVASEGMSLEERGARIQDYESGLYDCIVHVGILGEGYDNPKISVAAIFRPYRSLSPYAQFVGRTLRWIRDAAPDDNLAHVVSHVGLNLNFLWEYYKHESREAAILAYIDQLFFNDESGAAMSEDEVQPELELEPELTAEVTGEVIEGYDIDTFLPVPGLDTSYIGRTVQRAHVMLATFQGQSFREHSRMQQKQERQDRLLNHRQRSGRPLHTPAGLEAAPPVNLTLPFNRPDLERRQYRQWLNKEVQRAAGFVMFTLNIPTDDSFVEAIGDGNERNNYEAIIRGINRVVNRLMNKEESNSKRNDWTLDEFQRARPLVARARDVVLRVMKRNIENRQHKLPF